MKDIIKTAIVGYVRSLIILLVCVSTMAIIQAKCVLNILGYALFIFVATEVIYYIITKSIKFIVKAKAKHDHNR